MKHLKFLYFLTIILISSYAKAQTKADIFGSTETPITWLGLDFSQAIYLGDPGTVSPEEMKGLFSKINILVMSEPDKYDFKSAFKKSNVESNISYTEENNRSLNAEKIISYNSKDYKRLDLNSIKLIVDSYKFKSFDKGIGLVFIIDGMNKSIEEATIWVTFINIETKEIIFTVSLTGKAGGFGFRNHWAGAVDDIIKYIKTSYYKELKAKYGSSK